jgi:hypothetical protein
MLPWIYTRKIDKVKHNSLLHKTVIYNEEIANRKHTSLLRKASIYTNTC